MADPATIAGATFSGLNALLALSKHYFHFKEVPAEVSQLRTNIVIADNALGTARRLQRLDGMCLGDTLIADANSSIKCVESILDSIRETLEGSRRDMQLRGTVGTRQRTLWLLWGQQEFTAKLATLTNALAALNRDITRMELAVRSLPSDQGPPTVKLLDHAAESVRFPRSPTMRRTLHKRTASPGSITFSDNSSQVTLVESIEQASIIEEEAVDPDEAEESRTGLYLTIPHYTHQPSVRTAVDSVRQSPYHSEFQSSTDPLRRAITAPERIGLSQNAQGYTDDQSDEATAQQPTLATPSTLPKGINIRRRSNFI